MDGVGVGAPLSGSTPDSQGHVEISTVNVVSVICPRISPHLPIHPLVLGITEWEETQSDTCYDRQVCCVLETHGVGSNGEVREVFIDEVDL